MTLNSIHNVGDCVAWRMIDGNVMVGYVSSIGYSCLWIVRVDGGICTIRKDDAWTADHQDMTQALSFYGVKAS